MDSQKDFRDLENDLAEFSEASHSIINDSKNLAKELKQKYRERLDNFGVRELINITMRYKNTHMKKGTNWALARVGGTSYFT